MASLVLGAGATYRVCGSGMTYEQSLSQVSQEMGHERGGDITEHYPS